MGPACRWSRRTGRGAGVIQALTCHLSPSPVTCHLSPVTCHPSHHPRYTWLMDCDYRGMIPGSVMELAMPHAQLQVWNSLG